jgi:carboxyl-terminal processing protease
VAFPSGFSTKEQGERALKHALPFARIAAANFEPWTKQLDHVDDLRTRHEQRMKTDKAYLALLAQERAVQEVADRNSLSLVESKRRAEHEKARLDQRARENDIRIAHGKPALPAVPDANADDEEDKSSDSEEDKGKAPGDFDVILEEATKVLGDAIDLGGASPKSP